MAGCVDEVRSWECCSGSCTLDINADATPTHPLPARPTQQDATTSPTHL
ncbi:hypothetical protein ACHAXH_004657 [Discostella pseudostelligera]